MAGFPLRTGHQEDNEGGCRRPRIIWTSPGIVGSALPPKRPPQSMDTDKFSCPHPSITSKPRNPPTLRSIYPELVRRRVAQEPMSTAEITFLDHSLISDSEEGTRYASLPEWGLWMGLTPGEIASVRNYFPCEHLGQFGTRTRPFCANCSQTLGVLGAAWHAGDLSDIINKVLYELTVAIQKADYRNWWKWDSEPHACGHRCPLARNSL